MNNNRIFDMTENGDYPNESYAITPRIESGFLAGTPFLGYETWNGSWANLGPCLTMSFINYHRNPSVSVIDLCEYTYKDYQFYTNASYITASPVFPVNMTPQTGSNFVQYIERTNTISFEQNSIINFDISSLRKDYRTPYEFNFFYFRTTPTDNYPLGTFYGYLLYPNRIFLNPTNLSYSGGKWSLTTNVKILNTDFISISESSYIENDALTIHKNRVKTLPSSSNLNSGLNANNITFDLKACRSKNDYPAFIFGDTIPSLLSTKVDSNNDVVYIYPDTSFITFSAAYDAVYMDNGVMTKVNNQPTIYIQQDQPTSLSFSGGFGASFIPVYNPSSGLQTFKIIQEALNPYTLTDPPVMAMADASNCVLSATLANDGTFNLYNPYPLVNVDFQNGKYMGVNCIADCSKLSIPDVTASSTLNSFTVNGSPATLNTNYTGSTIGTNNIVWETNYPPHCYSYKIKLLDSTGTAYLDSNSLNFYIKLSSDVTLNTITLSAYMGSDFNIINYPFDNSISDNIAYQITNTSLSSIDKFLLNVKCYYGSSYDREYTLTDAHFPNSAQFKTANEAKNLKIVYTGGDFSGVSFTIRASLKTAAGQLDQFEPVNLNFKLPTALNGNSIFLDTIKEESNLIELNASYNVNASSWPSRDLLKPPATGSQILWDWYHGSPGNKDLNLAFNYIDLDGNYIAPVNGPINFSNKSWAVALSGYGPNQITVTLSSAKYNETASKVTNPSLYNFLNSGKFIVTPLTDLDNLNLTRTIQLKAQIPYGNEVFDIPPTIPIYWTWEYDDVKNENLLPITADQILNNNLDYVYSSNGAASILSAIQINVTPGYSKTIPRVHKVKVIAYTDIISPSVSGSYTFYVDDFPDPSIFNTDFVAYYSNFTTSTDSQIADTRTDDTVTRPYDSDLNFTFKANNDVLPKIKNGYTKWIFNDHEVENYTDTYAVDLYSNISLLTTGFSYGYPITSTKIGLNLYSGLAPGWTSAHNIKSNLNFYLLSSEDFYNPLNFIIYPEYAWLEPDTTRVTLLSTDPTLPSYYTNSFRPSAYGNRKHNSQTFWLSANKQCFNSFVYQNLDTSSVIETASSYDLLDISYNPYDLASSIGIPIALYASNDTFYPENIRNPYKISKIVNGLQVLKTEYHTITSQTIDFRPPTKNVANNFFLSPVILPYNYLKLNYTPNQKDINLDINPKISITQTLGTYPANQPAVVIGGTITYYLSSHFWEVSKTVPAVDGTYSLFELQIGDPTIPLNAGELGIDYFHLYAKTNVNQKIPATTFDNYSITEYPKDRDLWNIIKV